MENGPLLGVLAGVLVGAAAVVVTYWDIGTIWARWAVALPLVLSLILLMIRRFQHLVVTGEADSVGQIPPEPPLTRRWRTRGLLAGLTLLVLVVLNELVICSYYFRGLRVFRSRGAAADDFPVGLVQAAAVWLAITVLLLAVLAYGIYANTRAVRAAREHSDRPAQPDPAGEHNGPGAKEAGGVWHRSGALRWTVYLLLIFVVPQTCLWVTLDTINRRKVERKLQAIRDAGDPVTMTEAAPAPVPDDQNAAILYQQLFRVDFKDEYHSKESLLEATGHNRLIVNEFGKDGSNADRAREVLNDPAVISIFETLEHASTLPNCVFPVRLGYRWVASLHLPRMREAALWVAAKARLCAINGDPDEAMRWLGVIFRMADHASQGATYDSQLNANAIQRSGLSQLQRTLSETTLSAEATRNLLDHLERLDVMQWSDQALQGERATGIDMYAELRCPRPGHDAGAKLVRGPKMRLLYCYRFRICCPLYNADLSTYLTRMDELVSRSAQVPAQPETPPAPRRRLPFELKLDLMQAVDLFYTSRYLPDMRDIAIMENDIGRVALALTLYEIERGDYPATLADLQATLDWELPRDFFAGAPLTYQRRTDGFLLYSFGPDREDDGGTRRRGPGHSWKNYDAVWECGAP